jgi:hypothetical protein
MKKTFGKLRDYSNDMLKGHWMTTILAVCFLLGYGILTWH